MRVIMAAWIAILVRWNAFCSGVRVDHGTARVTSPGPIFANSSASGVFQRVHMFGSSGASAQFTMPMRRMRASLRSRAESQPSAKRSLYRAMSSAGACSGKCGECGARYRKNGSPRVIARVLLQKADRIIGDRRGGVVMLFRLGLGQRLSVEFQAARREVAVLVQQRVGVVEPHAPARS